MFITFPGRSVHDVRPKNVVRSSRVVRVDSGPWNHGFFQLSFDSSSDAARVEAELRKLLLSPEELVQRLANRRLYLELFSIFLGLVGYAILRLSCSPVTGLGCDDPAHQFAS